MPSATLWLTDADLAAAARMHRNLGRGHGYRRDLLVTVPFVWFIALGPEGLSEGLVLFSSLVGFVLGFWVYGVWRAWRLIKRSRCGKAAMELQEVAWSESGLSTTTRLGTSFRSWPRFRQWTEENGMLLLYSDIRVYQILPRRLFGSLVETLKVQNYLVEAGVRRVGRRRR